MSERGEPKNPPEGVELPICCGDSMEYAGPLTSRGKVLAYDFHCTSCGEDHSVRAPSYSSPAYRIVAPRDFPAFPLRPSCTASLEGMSEAI